MSTVERSHKNLSEERRNDCQPLSDVIQFVISGICSIGVDFVLSTTHFNSYFRNSIIKMVALATNCTRNVGELITILTWNKNFVFFLRIMPPNPSYVRFYGVLLCQIYLCFNYFLFFFGFILLTIGLCNYVQAFADDLRTIIAEIDQGPVHRNSKTSTMDRNLTLKQAIEMHQNIIA